MFTKGAKLIRHPVLDVLFTWFFKKRIIPTLTINFNHPGKKINSFSHVICQNKTISPHIVCNQQSIPLAFLD